MKFRIRFADQIVGVLIIIALSVLVFVIFLLGSKQRWFANDPVFKTYFLSASGLSENMSVLYKGFVIGNVKTFKLTEYNEVEVVFSIHKEYMDRVKEGSLVDLNISPIGLGNQFLFYPGLGEEPIVEGAYIPTVSSAQGQTLVQLGLSSVTARDDSISNILSQVDSLTKTLNDTLQDVQQALRGTDATTLGRSLKGVENVIVGLDGQLNQVVDELPVLLVNLQTLIAELDMTIQIVNGALAGTNATALGRTLGSVDTALAGLAPQLGPIADNANSLIAQINKELPETMENVNGVLKELPAALTEVQSLLAKLNEPNGLVASALDVNGPVYTGLTSAIASINDILKNIDTAISALPAQVPAMLMELRSLLKKVDDVLVSVQNNPIFKNGIPDQVQIQSTGMNPREVTF
ncbi:MAG: MlaD family protein [Treponema sp.]|nr:MlaD family protein [Treponema sp.]